MPPYLLPGGLLPVHSSREAEFGTTLLHFGSLHWVPVLWKKWSFQMKERKGKGQSKELEKSFSS